MTPTQIHYLTFKRYLGEETIQSFCTNGNLRCPRGRLQKLPFEQFNDLTTDVYDELKRRTERKNDSPYLTQSNTFPELRNLGRQKLGTLPDKRFKDLATDLFFDLLIRYPDLDPELRSRIRDLPQTSTRPLPPQTPPSPIRMSMFDVSGVMSDVSDRKSNGYQMDPSPNGERVTSQRSAVERVSKRYEAELAAAYRTNQELEMKLMSRNSNYSNHTPSTNSSRDYDLLKEDYHKLRQEYERTRLHLKELQTSNRALSHQNTEVRQSLSLYEAQGSLSLASQFAALQREYAGMKHEYQVEMEDLRRKYVELEQAQDHYLDIIETISKNNEILETKLKQVNQALESAQQDSMVYLRQTNSISPQDPTSGYLISDQLIHQLQSATQALLTTLRADDGSVPAELPVQPVVQAHKQVSTTVHQFLREIQRSHSPTTPRNSVRQSTGCQLEIRRLDDDFDSALANLLTLSKQYHPHSNLTPRFEREVEELNLSAQDLQLALQTNFCALPYFKVPNHLKPSLQQLKPTAKVQGTRTFDDDPQLDPLREYLEEQAHCLILRFDDVMHLIKQDDFSTNLTEALLQVSQTVQTVLSETKQYTNVPHLSTNLPLQATLEQLDTCLQSLNQLHLDLQPILDAKGGNNLDVEEVERMEPILNQFKIDLAQVSFTLAKHTKLLVRAIS